MYVNYSINSKVFVKKDVICELVIALGSQLRFSAHIDAIEPKGYKDIGKQLCVKVVYCANVRSVLEYGCEVPFMRAVFRDIKGYREGF